MGKGARIATIAGIDIILDGSLLIIFLLVALSLGAGVLPTWHPDWGAILLWTTAFTAAAMLLVSVLLHELSHALVGRLQGLKIPRITLFVLGGMAELEHEPHNWRAELWMALAGPVMSAVIGIACIAAGGALLGDVPLDRDDPLRTLAAAGSATTILLWLGPLNIALALFNMVPGFPLDGGRVLRAALWGLTGDLYRATRAAAAVGQLVAWALIATGFAMMLGVRVPYFGSGLIGGMWIALIGWFLNNAAIMSYRQVRAQRSLGNVTVARVMRPDFATVPADLPVLALVDDYFLVRDQPTYPVVDGGRLVGIVSLADVRKVPPSERARRKVSEMMSPVGTLPTVSPDAPAAEALSMLSRSPIDIIPVVKDGVPRGLLRREDLLKWIALHEGDESEPEAFAR